MNYDHLHINQKYRKVAVFAIYIKVPKGKQSQSSRLFQASHSWLPTINFMTLDKYDIL